MAYRNKHSRKYDICIFGATGYTGELLVECIAKSPSKYEYIRIAIAGRSVKKLEELVARHDLKNIGLISADVADESSLKAMTDQSFILITCVGPYSLYGEPVARACIESKTHYIDITGETAFVNKLAHDYHQKAKDANIVMLPAAGFDSVPADVLVSYTLRCLLSRPVPVKHIAMSTVVQSQTLEGTTNSGPMISHGTFQTIVTSLSGEMPASFRAIRISPAAGLSLDMAHKILKLVSPTKMHYNNDLKSYCFPWEATSDAYIAKRNFILTHPKQDITFEYSHYLKTSGWLASIAMGVFFVIFAILCKLPFTRGWIKGRIQPGQGPAKETRENTHMALVAVASAYTEAHPGPNTQPIRKIVTRFHMPCNGYSFTAPAALECALSLLADEYELPENGEHYGVLTPSALFGTHIQHRLADDGLLKLSVITEKDY